MKLGSTKGKGERRVGRMSVVCAHDSIFGKGTFCVRVVSGNTAFIKSAIAFISALRPIAASSVVTRIAIYLPYGRSDFFFFFFFFVTRARVLCLVLCAVF